jgi:hypothetical protein
MKSCHIFEQSQAQKGQKRWWPEKGIYDAIENIS